MVEIHPVIPVYPVVKPVKIRNDEDRPKKKQQEQPQTEQEPPQDAEPVQHIDEIV